MWHLPTWAFFCSEDEFGQTSFPGTLGLPQFGVSFTSAKGGAAEGLIYNKAVSAWGVWVWECGRWGGWLNSEVLSALRLAPHRSQILKLAAKFTWIGKQGLIFLERSGFRSSWLGYSQTGVWWRMGGRMLVWRGLPKHFSLVFLKYSRNSEFLLSFNTVLNWSLQEFKV